MAEQLARAVALFVTLCPHVTAIHDLITKVRIELKDGYFLDLYFNPTLKKYSYALILHDQRVIGWDNAPHHHNLANYPHHLHEQEGEPDSSELVGDPEKDVVIVAARVNTLLG